MGYRIDIYNKSHTINYYGTKHYGYCENERELESFKYLVSIGKFKGNEIFNYCRSNEIELTAEEFIRFITLYSKEYMEEMGSSYNMLDDYVMIDLMKDKENKEVRWL